MALPLLVTLATLQYGVPVIKYDRKGFKARQRQLLLTQRSAYLVELSKVKQKIEYAAVRGECQAVSEGLYPLSHVLRWLPR